MRDSRTKNLFLNKVESEKMGLKYYLGHTGYVTSNNGDKMYLTKSSIRLNKLADLQCAAENIEHKFRKMNLDNENKTQYQKEWL